MSSTGSLNTSKYRQCWIYRDPSFGGHTALPTEPLSQRLLSGSVGRAI